MEPIDDVWGKTGVLAFPINCDAVLQHLKQDMRDDWFFDAIHYKDLFANKDDLKNVLIELLHEGNGRYIGGKRNVCDIPKKSLGIRYSLETDFYDRFIYQSICTFLIPFFDPLLSHRVLGHRYNKRRTSERYLFKNRIELWQTFEGVTHTAIADKKALLATDLINYFENISIEVIERSFEALMPKVSATGPDLLRIRNAIQTLLNLLTKWGYSDRHGLPQNRDASSFIANIVLNAVDHRMQENGYDYYRYVDDIRIICDSSSLARKALTDLVIELRTVGMNINSAKTRVLDSKTDKSILADFFPGTDDRTATIDNMWRSRSYRVISRSSKYIFELIKECIDQENTQSRQFRFAVNRLLHLAEANLFDVTSAVGRDLLNLLLNSLESHPASADQYCRLIKALKPSLDDLERIHIYLADHEKSIYKWQNYHLWFVLAANQYKTDELLKLALHRVEKDISSPECAAIFIYLHCTNASAHLKEKIELFSADWPYQQRRHFLFAVKNFEKSDLKPIVERLDLKLKNTIKRAKSHFDENDLPLPRVERPSISDLYDRIDPYD